MTVAQLDNQHLNHQLRRDHSASRRRELVVLIHGLAANRAMLKPLEGHVRQGGFETLNWGYRSITGDIRRLGNSLADQLRELDEDDCFERIHLVTHSMGSIIARAALVQQRLPRLGRIVMLGPPHRGSHIAAKFARTLGWFCKPLTQLSDAPNSLVNSLPEPEGYEIGIVAASHDRVVRIESTWLKSQKDHIVVGTGHTSMLFRPDVAELVSSFLREGRFVRQLVSAQRWIDSRHSNDVSPRSESQRQSCIST